jgi:hypothetical protein
MNYLVKGSDGSKWKHSSYKDAMDDLAILQHDNQERALDPSYQWVDYHIEEEDPLGAAIEEVLAARTNSESDADRLIRAFEESLQPIEDSPYLSNESYVTMDEAGRAAVKAINDRSASFGFEYSGEIYEKGGRYHYTQARLGSRHGTGPIMRRPFGRLVASYHTHGESDEAGGDESFSWQDLDEAQTNVLPIYLGTPRNSMGVQKYTPNRSMIGWESIYKKFEGEKFRPKAGLSTGDTLCAILSPNPKLCDYTSEYKDYLIHNGRIEPEPQAEEWPAVQVSR